MNPPPVRAVPLETHLRPRAEVWVVLAPPEALAGGYEAVRAIVVGRPRGELVLADLGRGVEAISRERVYRVWNDALAAAAAWNAWLGRIPMAATRWHAGVRHANGRFKRLGV